MSAKISRTLVKTATLLWLACVSLGAQAGLVYRNVGGTDLVYDPLQGVLWTRNADISGQTFTWQDAQNWAASLSMTGWATLHWKLPTAAQFTSLFTQLEPYGAPGTVSHKLGDKVYFGSGPEDFVARVEPFYWTDTSAQGFNFYYGYVGFDGDGALYSAWALAAVPVPSSLSLTGLALLGLVGLRANSRP